MSATLGEGYLVPPTATATATAATRAMKAAIAERNDRESPLLRLPAELRNRIYEYALTDGTYEFSAPNGGIWPYPAGLGIVSACQRLYHEVSLLPFSLNDFYYRSSADLVKLHSRLSIRQLSAITKVTFSGKVQIPVIFNGRMMTPISEMESQRSGVYFNELFPNARRVTLFDGWNSFHDYMSSGRGPCPDYMGPGWNPVISSWIGRGKNPGLVIVYKTRWNSTMLQ